MTRKSSLFGAAFGLMLVLRLSTAQAVSVGNGGSSPIGVYQSTAPTLTSGQQAAAQVDVHGKLIISPSSFPSVQPISASSPLPISVSTTIPVSLATTVPVSIGTTVPVALATGVTVNGNVSINPSSFPSVQAVKPFPSSSPFPVIETSTVPVVETTTVPVTGTVNIGNLPTTQPVSFSTAQPIYCVSGCSGSGGGSSNLGQYNSTLPTYSNTAIVTPQYDVNGLGLLSPSNDFEVGNAIYRKNPTPLGDGQVIQPNTDQWGDQYIRERNPIQITVSQQGEVTDRSAAITTASTSQTVMPPSQYRHGEFICDDNATLSLWFDPLGGLAKADYPSIYLAPLQCWTAPPFYAPHGSMNVYASSTAVHFTAEEW